jgi:hypothetical protein
MDAGGKYIIFFEIIDGKWRIRRAMTEAEFCKNDGL